MKRRAEASQLKVLTSKSSPDATSKVVTRVVNSTVVNGTASQAAILTLDGENSQLTKVRLNHFLKLLMHFY